MQLSLDSAQSKAPRKNNALSRITYHREFSRRSLSDIAAIEVRAGENHVLSRFITSGLDGRFLNYAFRIDLKITHAKILIFRLLFFKNVYHLRDANRLNSS